MILIYCFNFQPPSHRLFFEKKHEKKHMENDNTVMCAPDNFLSA